MANKEILGPGTKVVLNGTDLSQYVSDVSVESTTDEIDLTGMGEPYREFGPGLKDATITLTLFQDYGAGGPDGLLAPMDTTGAAGTLKVTPEVGTVVYTMISKLYGYSPVSGAVGAANQITATFRNAGTAGLTRGTS